MNREDAWLFSCALWNERQRGVSCFEPVDNDCRRSLVIVGDIVRGFRGVVVVFLELRWNVDVQPGQGHRSKPSRPAEEPDETAVEFECSDRDQGRHVLPALVANDEVGAGYVDCGKRIHTKGFELDLAIQSLGQRLDYELAKGGGARPSAGDYCQQNQQAADDRNRPASDPKRHNELIYPKRVPTFAASSGGDGSPKENPKRARLIEQRPAAASSAASHRAARRCRQRSR